MTGLAEHYSYDYKGYPAVNGYELAYVRLLLSPIIAAAMTLSSLSVIVNSALLKRAKPTEEDGMMNRWYGPCPWLAAAVFVHIGVLEFNQT